MTDVHTPEQRSRNMRAVLSANTKPEIAIRKILFSAGFRFRLHVRTLAGVPDIVLPKHRAVIFVHGCFWHGHDCYLFKVPQTRTEFWLTKIGDNRSRDVRHQQTLLAQGWRVMTVWECAVKGPLRHGHSEIAGALTDWLQGEQGDLRVAELRHRTAA